MAARSSFGRGTSLFSKLAIRKSDEECLTWLAGLLDILESMLAPAYRAFIDMVRAAPPSVWRFGLAFR
jgi:hypothetical protein